jgi:hypothetical protein
MTVYRLHEQIRQAGFEPAQRDSRYNIVRSFDRPMTKEELAPLPIKTRMREANIINLVDNGKPVTVKS